MQQWFNLSDPQAEDGLYDSESMRRFAGLDLGDDAIPDETTICQVPDLLEQHQLTSAIFRLGSQSARGAPSAAQNPGRSWDATLIAAPPSTKNQEKARDPEMKQTRKGKDWHFGMKLHVGTDVRGTVHTVTATHAAVSDFKPDARAAARRRRGGLRRPRLLEPRRPCHAGGTGRALPHQPAGNGEEPVSERWRLINRRVPGPGRAASMRSAWSSNCGALPRCATAGWPRTSHEPSRCRLGETST